ncbi:histone-lysine N-methyltransferase SETMAR [Trichonephila clavipes]|nr:histone-lysine N-methyltransferase SETMAR [Trichonephila clavipes]
MYAFAAWGILNSRRAASPLVWLVERGREADYEQLLEFINLPSTSPKAVLFAAVLYKYQGSNPQLDGVFNVAAQCSTRAAGDGPRNFESRYTYEAWLLYYDPTIKQQSSEWKQPSSPSPKKAKTVKSAGKVITIIFFNYEEIEYQNAVEPSTTVNDSYYTNVLPTIVQQVKRKRPFFRNGFLLRHDNVRPHIVRCVPDVSQQNNVEILPHPPYSPDLTPCDFWLFPQLKKPL